MVYLDSLDSSRNLQANYAINFLFYLDLILYACKILLRCDSFGILNFAIKQDPKVGTTSASTVARDLKFRSGLKLN